MRAVFISLRTQQDPLNTHFFFIHNINIKYTILHTSRKFYGPLEYWLFREVLWDLHRSYTVNAFESQYCIHWFTSLIRAMRISILYLEEARIPIDTNFGNTLIGNIVRPPIADNALTTSNISINSVKMLLYFLERQSQRTRRWSFRSSHIYTYYAPTAGRISKTVASGFRC